MVSLIKNYKETKILYPLQRKIVKSKSKKISVRIENYDMTTW